MKSIILVLFALVAINAPAQTLKDALYSGKLKTDSGTVLRKGEDLTGKIDTAVRKKEPAPEKIKPVITSKDSISTMSAAGITTDMDTVSAATTPVASSKDNNKTWKEFTNTVVAVLKQEVLPSKKIKKGDYTVTLDYEIGLDGTVTIKNVFVSPENSFITEQVRERFSIDTPKLAPVINSGGQARKTIKRTNFVLAKD